METTVQIPEKPYLKSSEVARLFGVNHSTVFLWVKKGRLKPKRTLGGNFRFSRDQVVSLWEQHANGRSRGENRTRPRFTIMCPVTVSGLVGGEPFSCSAVVTDISSHGVGLRVEDTRGMLSLFRQGRVETVDIRNKDHAVIRETVRGTVRHFELVDEGEINLGISLSQVREES